MKKEKDRKLFLLFLIIAFVALCLGDTFGWISRKKAVEAINIPEEKQNNLTLEILDADTYRVLGEGSLEGSEINNLLKKNSIPTTDIVNLILGDGFSEIGYNCINNYPYLETLKIGANITRLRNGTIANCKALEWVMIPNGLEKVGRSFLTGCPNAIIVMSGSNNVIDTSTAPYELFENASSFIALQSVFQQSAVLSFTTEDLYTDGEITSNGAIRLKTGTTQYGPYTPILPGEYHVEVSGKNLQQVRYEDIYIHPNADYSIEPFDLVTGEQIITYAIDVPTELYRLELGIKNGISDYTLEINSLEIYKRADAELPNALRLWWD